MHWIHIIAHIFVQYIYWYCTHAHMVVQSMSIGNWFTLLWINWITLNFWHEWYSAQVSWSSIAILVCIRCVHVTQYRNLETAVSLPLAHYYYAVDWLIEWRMCTFLCMYAFLTYWTVCGFVEYLKLWAKCVFYAMLVVTTIVVTHVKNWREGNRAVGIVKCTYNACILVSTRACDTW